MYTLYQSIFRYLRLCMLENRPWYRTYTSSDLIDTYKTVTNHFRTDAETE